MRDSDGALIVRYPGDNKNVVLHPATVTKVVHFRGEDVMIVNDENLIRKYHGPNKVKVSGHRLKEYNMKYFGLVFVV